MSKEKYNPRLKRLILEVVDNQIRDNTPPITRETLNRLQAGGYTEQQAKEKIAAEVIGDIYDMLMEHKPFDEAKYTASLKALK